MSKIDRGIPQNPFERGQVYDPYQTIITDRQELLAGKIDFGPEEKPLYDLLSTLAHIPGVEGISFHRIAGSGSLYTHTIVTRLFEYDGTPVDKLDTVGTAIHKFAEEKGYNPPVVPGAWVQTFGEDFGAVMDELKEKWRQDPELELIGVIQLK